MKHNYLVSKPFLVLFILFLFAHVKHAQTKTVSGTVKSAEDGVPVPGVNIVVKNTTTGSVTDVMRPH